MRASNLDKGRLDAVMVLALIRYLWRLTWMLFSFRPDFILYRPTSATLKGWIRDGSTLLLGRIFGGKVIVRFGGGHFRYFFDSLSGTNRRIIRWLLGKSAMVLADSRSLQAQFRDIVPQERIRYLYNAVPPDFFEYFSQVQRPCERDPVMVLFVGHLSQAKGYCDVLKTIPDLSRKHHVRFCFIGARQRVERNVFINQRTGQRIAPEDADDCYRRNIEEHGLQDRVEFLGDRVYGEAKCKAFADADIFVLPSYSEGFSRAVLEGLAASLPVVVTHVGAVPDIIREGVEGFIIEPGDIPALNDRLERLIANANLRLAMGKAGRERCAQLCEGEQLSAQLVRMLDSLQT